MYPVLFRIGDFEITSFGVLVANRPSVEFPVFLPIFRSIRSDS
jgi:hypothetical protein